MTTVFAVYENGVFRPTQPVTLRDGETVQLTVTQTVSLPSMTPIPEFASDKPSPEILEWARKQHTPDEIAALFREMRETGGLELKDFIGELEALAKSP